MKHRPILIRRTETACKIGVLVGLVLIIGGFFFSAWAPSIFPSLRGGDSEIRMLTAFVLIGGIVLVASVLVGWLRTG